MQKSYLTLVISAFFLHFLLQRLPTYTIIFPKLLVDAFAFLSLVSLVICLVLPRISKSKPSLPIFLSTVSIFLVCLVYLNFPLSEPVNDPPPVTTNHLQAPGPTAKSYIEYTDPRCIFFEYYRVVRSSQTDYILTDYSLKPFGWGNLPVHYFPGKEFAVTKFNDENYTDPHLLLLDFTTCKAKRFYNHKFSNPYFLPRVVSVSPDERHLLYEIYHGTDTDVMDPKILEEYTAADSAQNGLWVYTLENGQTNLIKRIKVDTDTQTLTVTWNSESVFLHGLDCPSPAGCEIPLN